jgi:DNA polymerase III subunit epsilon
MPKSRNRDLLVVDVETSGINPFRHDVLAVGLVPLCSELAATVVYVRPKVIEWGGYAKKNFEKYSDDWEKAALEPSAACILIESYLAETFGGRTATPVGHNIGFDVAFLRRLAFLGGRDQLAGLSHRAIDTHTLLYLLAMQGRIPHEAVTSDGAFKYFGITIDERVRHTALGDSKATRELVRKVFAILADSSGKLDI